MVVAGAAMIGYMAWQYVGTNIVSAHRQEALKKGLTEQWRREAGTAPGGGTSRGGAIALVRIPRFGRHYEMPLVAGVNQGSLARGIGWSVTSARPGAVGNVVIAGHRVTHGEPFRDFLTLRRGDTVEIETRTHVYTYVLRDAGTDRTVDFTDTWVTDPVPGEPPGTPPTRRLITLVTCSELFHTDNRQVVLGELDSAELKASSS
jgi:sortase A